MEFWLVGLIKMMDDVEKIYILVVVVWDVGCFFVIVFCSCNIICEISKSGIEVCLCSFR